MQASVEMLPLEDDPLSDLLASGTDIETTQKSDTNMGKCTNI